MQILKYRIQVLFATMLHLISMNGKKVGIIPDFGVIWMSYVPIEANIEEFERPKNQQYSKCGLAGQKRHTK